MKWRIVLTVTCIALLNSASLASSGEVSSIHTIAADHKMGISSVIVLIHRNNQAEHLGSTAPNGVRTVSPPILCKRGMKLEVTPGTGWYQETTKLMDCHREEYVYLERNYFGDNFTSVENEAIMNIAYNLETASKAGDFALVALLYNELAAEMLPVNEKLSREYSSRAITFFALAADYSGILSKGRVLSGSWESFIGFVQSRQAAQNIPKTGILDYETLSVEANRNVHWFRNRTYQIIDQVPTLEDFVGCENIDFLKSRDDLASSPIVRNLLSIAKEKEQLGKFGDAALLFNEAYARVPPLDRVAKLAAHEAFMNAGKVLGVGSPVRCDPEQNKFVLTSSMVEALKSYQKVNGIPSTGKLNYRTVRSFSDFGIGDYLSILHRM